METRKVLTVNQMVEILVNYGQSKSWETAFHAAIPKRKKAVALNSADTNAETSHTTKAEESNFEINDVPK